MPQGTFFIKTDSISSSSDNTGKVTKILDHNGSNVSWSCADAYVRYGISLEETSMSKLMTPAPNKVIVENKSDLQHGKRIERSTTDVMKDERNVSLIINITAKSQSDFLTKYAKFCKEVLDDGFLDITTSYWPNTVFRLTYLDCTQFSEFDTRIGKFTLSVNEPDPTNRGAVSSW